jgi:hypothetical protein
MLPSETPRKEMPPNAERWSVQRRSNEMNGGIARATMRSNAIAVKCLRPVKCSVNGRVRSQHSSASNAPRLHRLHRRRRLSRNRNPVRSEPRANRARSAARNVAPSVVLNAEIAAAAAIPAGIQIDRFDRRF